MADLGRVGEILIGRIDKLERSVEKLSDKIDDLKGDLADDQLAYEKRFNAVTAKYKDLKMRFYILALILGGGGGSIGTVVFKFLTSGS